MVTTDLYDWKENVYSRTPLHLILNTQIYINRIVSSAAIGVYSISRQAFTIKRGHIL